MLPLRALPQTRCMLKYVWVDGRMDGWTDRYLLCLRIHFVQFLTLGHDTKDSKNSLGDEDFGVRVLCPDAQIDFPRMHWHNTSQMSAYMDVL